MNTTVKCFSYNITNFVYRTNDYFKEYQNVSIYSEMIMFLTILIICCIGVPLNGIVIWLLGFQIKRNPFTVLILNLTIADFGSLLLTAIHCINYFADFIPSGITCVFFLSISDGMYINGVFLLVAISIDQCVAVLFPIWHRCSRPKYLSPAVCAFLWICSVLLGGIPNIVEYVLENNNNLYPRLLLTTGLCIPLITIFTVILLIKIVLKSKQNQWGRLLVMILITLLCFLIFTVPLDSCLFIINVLDKNYFSQFPLLDKCFQLGACLNSSINPVIYFLVGRKKQTQSRESIKAIFQRIFREDQVFETRQKFANTDIMNVWRCYAFHSLCWFCYSGQTLFDKCVYIMKKSNQVYFFFTCFDYSRFPGLPFSEIPFNSRVPLNA